MGLTVLGIRCEGGMKLFLGLQSLPNALLHYQPCNVPFFVKRESKVLDCYQQLLHAHLVQNSGLVV